MRFVFVLLLLLVTPMLAEQPREFTLESGVVMKRYYLLLYLRGDKSNDYNEAELETIQAGHLAHITHLTEKGIVLLAGPFGDDTDKRGLLLFDLPELEEVKEWAAQDPAVKAGRLTYEIHPWYGAKGATLK